MGIVCRILLVTGSMRARVPTLSVIIQMLSPLAVIPPSGPAGPMGRLALIWFVRELRRTSEFALPHNGTQRLPNPNARPAHGSPGTGMIATSLLVLGSIRWTDAGFELATQTASSVI